MNQQEYGQEQANQGHQQLLADGGIKDVAHMLMIFGCCKQRLKAQH